VLHRPSNNNRYNYYVNRSARPKVIKESLGERSVGQRSTEVKAAITTEFKILLYNF